MTAVNNVDVKLIAPELGVFFVVACVIFFVFMEKIKGKFYFIENYIASRDWEFLKSPEKLKKKMGILKYIIISILLWPCITIICWGVTLLYTEIRWGTQYASILGLGTFLACSSIVLVISGILNIKWENYKMNKNSIFLLISGLMSYISFKFVVVLMETPTNFIGVSAIFMSTNAMFVIIIIFFYQTNAGKNISEILGSLATQPGFEDAYDLFSIPKTETSLLFSAIGGGIQAIYASVSDPKHKTRAFIVLYILSQGILAGYSVVSYRYCDYYALGILNSILIQTIDIFVCLYVYTGVVKSPHMPVVLSLLSRFFIFIITEENWFIGYTCAYWVFTLVLVFDYIQAHFPLINSTQDLKRNRVNLGKTTGFVYLVVLVFYIILIVAVTLGEPTGVPLTNFYIQGYEFKLWIIGISSIVLSFLVFICLLVIRLALRKIRGIKDTLEYFLVYPQVDLFWIVGSIGILICWVCAVAVYLTTYSQLLITIFIIVPIIFLLDLSIYINWAKNDYSIIRDPADYNKKIKKIIEDEENIMKKVQEYQDKKISAEKPSIPPSLNNSVKSRFSRPDPPLKDKLGLVNLEKLKTKLPETIPDWKTSGSVLSAFFQSKLLKEDYMNLLMIFISISLSCTLVGVTYGIYHRMKYGVTISVLSICIPLGILPLEDYIRTSEPISVLSSVSIILSLIINYGYAYIYYHIELNQNSNSSENGINILFISFVFPELISFAYSFLKWRENKYKTTLFSNWTLISGFVFGIGSCVLLLIVVDVASGLALFGFHFVLLIYCYIAIKYTQTFTFSPNLKLFAVLVTFIIGCSSIVIGCLVSSLGIFQGCSITFLFFSALFIFYSVFNLTYEINRPHISPIFFSPWIFPIYKYDYTKQKIIRYDEIGFYMLLGLGVTSIWSISCVIWIYPTAVGVSVGCLCEIIFLLFTIFISSQSSLQLSEAFMLMKPDENSKTLKKAWNEAKSSFLEKKGAVGLKDFPTYEERFNKLKDLKEMSESKNIKIPNNNKAWAHLTTNMETLRDLYSEWYTEDYKAHEQYMHELELIIHFQLLITLTAFSTKNNEILFYRSFVSSKVVELKAYGIQIDMKDGGITLAEKHSHLFQQIAKLNHIQRTKFEEIKNEYIDELEKQRSERKLHEAEAKKALNERIVNSQNLHQLLKTKIKEQAQRDDIPIDEMVDSPEKYDKILKKFQTDGIKFEDKQFPANSSSLGPHTSQNTTGWMRAENCVLYGETVSASDVKQGAIGDCYYLSAISVLGEKRIKNIIISQTPDPKCGGYLIQFYKYDEKVYVIVDDIFPINTENKWAFAQTNNGTEIWPMLLEKAYAKLNGGYDNIVAGKVHYALADLTNGEPEEIKLEASKDNPEALWSKMVKYKSSSYPMGAGSPENPNGDLAVSQNGIVQGHAYAILDVQEVDSDRLIQLKNPHGQYGQEWRGDWGDGSSKWTKKAISKLNQKNLPDGIFWMSLEDFVWEYKNLYICRIFDDPKWKTEVLKGEWKGNKAAGFPCKDNPKVILENNPQYLVSISKNSTAFIVLTQKNAVDMFKGKCPILFLVYSGNKKVKEVSNNLIGSSGKPIDLRIVSAEIALDKGTSYVVLVTSMYQGEKGEGEFELTITIDDGGSKISQLS